MISGTDWRPEIPDVETIYRDLQELNRIECITDRMCIRDSGSTASNAASSNQTNPASAAGSKGTDSSSGTANKPAAHTHTCLLYTSYSKEPMSKKMTTDRGVRQDGCIIPSSWTIQTSPERARQRKI